MSNRIHALAQQLTDKTSVEECSLKQVQQITKRYPYFAPAQFLLLQKLQQIESPDVETLQQKAVLFFPDPLLFDYFMASDRFYNDENLRESRIESSPEINQHERIFIDAADQSEGVASGIEEVHIESAAILDDVDYGLEVENRSLSIVDTGSQDIQIDGIEAPFDNSSQKIEAVDEEVNKSNQVTPEIFVTVDSEQNIEKEIQTIANATNIVGQQLENEEFAFEPFHTVDYFASQGIKVSQDKLPNDKLGKQLKSFTDWLKTMKRLPAAHLTEKVEMIAEKKVENMASRSVSESTVITEAMAEVWAKQGNLEKAAEIYNKLSLLNPAKKAFFAAKIENLKTV